MVDTSLDRLKGLRIHPTARIGEGTIFWGAVVLDRGVSIGNYCVIGHPSVEDIDQEGTTEFDVTKIGAHTKIGSNVTIHNGSRLGQHVLVDDGCVVGPDTSIGDNTRLYYGARIYWRVRIGKGCTIAGFCCDRSVVKDRAIMMGKLIHKLADIRASWDTNEEPSPIVEKRACVGMDSLVIGGVKVGTGAYIAAGAVVAKDVPPKHIVVGTSYYTLSAWRKRNERRS